MKPLNSEPRKELKSLMEEKGLSLSSVSRALGISLTVLSQWLSNSYPGNVTKIDAAVKSFLERQKERLKASRKQTVFVMTSVAQKVFEVARICHLDEEIGVCYGHAGLGKTEAIKEYTRRNPDVLLIEADLGCTAKVVFAEIHKKLGMEGRGSIHDMFEDVISKLRDSGRLIIADEAENLPYKALELLRRVHDKAGIGILLVGMPRLLSNLRGKKGEYAQLYSRVGIAGKLESLRPQDTEKIILSAIPSSNGLWKTFHEASNGNTRVLGKLLLRSVRVAELNGVPVSPDIISQTARLLVI